MLDGDAEKYQNGAAPSVGPSAGFAKKRRAEGAVSVDRGHSVRGGGNNPGSGFQKTAAVYRGHRVLKHAMRTAGLIWSGVYTTLIAIVACLMVISAIMVFYSLYFAKVPHVWVPDRGSILDKEAYMPGDVIRAKRTLCVDQTAAWRTGKITRSIMGADVTHLPPVEVTLRPGCLERQFSVPIPAQITGSGIYTYQSAIFISVNQLRDFIDPVIIHLPPVEFRIDRQNK